MQVAWGYEGESTVILPLQPQFGLVPRQGGVLRGKWRRTGSRIAELDLPLGECAGHVPRTTSGLGGVPAQGGLVLVGSHAALQKFMEQHLTSTLIRWTAGHFLKLRRLRDTCGNRGRQTKRIGEIDPKGEQHHS